MLSSATRIAVAAAILLGTPLITATIHDGAMAASHVQPEVGVVIASPGTNQAYLKFNGPLWFILVRSPAWNELAKSAGGDVPGGDASKHRVDMELQRNEGGQWKGVYTSVYQLPGNLPNAKWQMDLWSKSNGVAQPMKNFPGLSFYRVRSVSSYKISCCNFTKMSDWKNFSVKNQSAVLGPGAIGVRKIPKYDGPTLKSSTKKSSTIGRLPAKKLKPGLKVPGRRAAPAMKKVAPVMKKAAPVVKAVAPALKKTAPLLKIAPATPGTVDSPTIDVPTLKMVPRQ